MLKAISVIFVLAFGLVAQAAITPTDSFEHQLSQTVDFKTVAQIKADASGYFDMVLANLREQMVLAGLDNIVLPNATISFSQVILGITWHGEAGLNSGFLKGMETLHRTGAADLSIEPNGDIVMSAEVGVNSASLGYWMKVVFMNLGPRVQVSGTLTKVSLILGLRVTSDFRVSMEQFDIKNTGILSITIKGLGAILNFLVEIVASFLGNLIKPIVVALLEGPIKAIINTIISSILFPPDVFQAVEVVRQGISLVAALY